MAATYEKGTKDLLHDIHGRIYPIDAMRHIKELEEFDPFFIEDSFPPETSQYYLTMLREQTSCPIAMGELFNNPTQEVFPGCPEIKDGYMFVNEAPGYGVDFDETLAAKFPVEEEPLN